MVTGTLSGVEMGLKLAGGPFANLVQWNTPIWFGAQGAMFIGTLIGLYVIKEAVEILGDARQARTESTPPTA